MLGGGDSRWRHSGTAPGPLAAAEEGGALERGKDGAGSSSHAVATGFGRTGSAGIGMHVFATGAEGTGSTGSGMHAFVTGAEGADSTGGEDMARGEHGEVVDRVHVASFSIL